MNPTAFETVESSPIRPDLTDVQPSYYVIVESAKFGSLKAMCRRHGWPLDDVQAYVARARIERSDYVVIDRLVMGEGEICAAVVFRPGGAVMLCCALVGDLTEDRDEALARASEFAELPDFKGKFIAVGEFRGNPRRPKH